MPIPAFGHDECHAVHRDVRSASEGAILRKCRCGKLLPITVSRAAWALDPVCQRCGSPMHQGAGAVRDVRVSVFGDVHAGKSRFTFAALDRLRAWSEAHRQQFTYADDESEEAVDDGLRAIRTGSTPTTGNDLPRAVTCRVGGVASGSLLHVFDTAGSRFHDVTSHDDLFYIGDSHGLVFVVDPFALDRVRSELRKAGHSGLLSDHPAGGQPEELYGVVVSRLRAAGHRVKGQRLAVVVTKADLLYRAGAPLPTDHRALSSWLYDRGEHNMVLAAEREFADVRYFAVASSPSSDLIGQFDPSAPLRWMLNPRRFASGATPAKAKA